MKKIWNAFKKHWIAVWLIVALATLSSLMIFAAYTEVSSVKRVVSTQASPSVLFSSNCMRRVLSMRRLSSDSYTVTVCNFDQDKPTLYNTAVIEYTLTAEIRIKVGDRYYTMSELQTADSAKYSDYKDKIEGKYFISKTYDDTDPGTQITDSNYRIGFNSANGFSVLLPHDADAARTYDTLAAQHSSVDKYKVEIDGTTLDDENPDIFIYMKASATDPSLGFMETLLYGAATTTDTAAWAGRMLETDCETVDYDFYNYIISGSGAGTVDILWDPSKFEINPFFFTDPENTFENNNSIPSDINSADPDYGQDYANWKKVTITVDSVVKNRYELQVYKTLQGTSYTNQDRADNFIKCFFNG